MKRNLECKARIQSVAGARRTALKLGAKKGGILHQKDTFVSHAPGRLKIREERGKKPELIYYTRPDTAEATGKWSSYLRVPLMSVDNMLAQFRGGVVTIRKRREVLLFRDARIHLDEVRDLGSFLEIEVVSAGDDATDRALFSHLVAAFRIQSKDFVHVAYADLMTRLRRA